MKRSPLRRNLPPKRPAYHKAWLVGRNYCWNCGWRPGLWSNVWPRRLETHEMVRGPNRWKAFPDPRCWIRTCNLCHEEEFATMPIAKQLAIKKLVDPEHYSRIAVNLLRVRDEEAVSKNQVDAEIKKLERAGFRPKEGE